jgi:hypothetical protein
MLLFIRLNQEGSMRRHVTLAGLIIIMLMSAGFAQYGQYSTRSLLEKKIFYVNTDGKIGTASFWALYLGDHSAVIPKHIPGKGEVPIDAQVNFSLLSSGYIEGKGYSSKGKIDAAADFAVSGPDSTVGLDLEEIDYVYTYGRKVKPADAEATDLILRAEETNNLTIKRMLLREFRYDKTYNELKFAEDIPIKAFSFTKAGAQRAAAAMRDAQ